jgi:hypothetical protein
VTSSYEIFFPFEEKEHEEGDTVRSFPSDSLEIEVKLWYLPYGTMWDDAFLWREEKRTVTISMAGK